VHTHTKLRQAASEDAAILSVLASQVFLDTYATKGVNRDLAKEVQSAYSVEVFHSRLKRPDVQIWVAEQDDYTVAFMDTTASTTCPTHGVSGIEVFRLYVQAPFHGQGIGRKLMSFAEGLARDQDRTHVWLTAWSGNHRALEFYKRVGYTDSGTTQYVIEGKAYENRVMVKRVAPSAA
jgi:diamine N-acetyltransferase